MQSSSPKVKEYKRFLLPEIPFQQPSERLSVPGFIPCHFMHGVMNSVQVQGLGALGQVGLAGGGAVFGFHAHFQVHFGAVGEHFAQELRELGGVFGLFKRGGLPVFAAREGYPEIAEYWKTAAWEDAEHAAKFAELLGEVLTDSTEKNLKMRVEAENGATAGKTDLAKRAKALNLDAIHDTVHEMARDEARHGKAFKGLLDRYFGK